MPAAGYGMDPALALAATPWRCRTTHTARVLRSKHPRRLALRLAQRTGARGLRTIIEEVLLDVMYEVPSRSDIKRITVNGDTIHRRAEPAVESRAEVTPLHTEKSA